MNKLRFYFFHLMPYPYILPEMVKNAMGDYCEDAVADGILNVGSASRPMPNWMIMKNMQIFPKEVMLEFREAGGKPDYMREASLAPTTHAETSAQLGKPEESARSHVTGLDDLIEHRTAPVPEVIDASQITKAVRDSKRSSSEEEVSAR